MGRNMRLPAALVVGTLLAGCGTQAGSPPPAPDPPRAGVPAATSAPPQRVDPVALIGSWALAETDEGAGEVLRLGHAEGYGDLLLFGRCGVLMSTWRADPNGLFVAGVPAGAVPDDGAKCRSSRQFVPAWLRRVTAFRVEGTSPVLVDEQGRHLARLLPGARPTPGPNLLPSLTEPPVVTDETRRAFGPAAALPPTLVPVRSDTMLGRWVSVDDRNAPSPRIRPEAPYLELGADGAWRGSDGCNGLNGRWLAGPAGTLLATSEPSTQIGCDNVSIQTWLATAWRAGLDGDTLVLLDVQGRELGRLRRAGPA
ncbi:META domain-containing protein [Micromonosporaceae bacterium B7E4]